MQNNRWVLLVLVPLASSCLEQTPPVGTVDDVASVVEVSLGDTTVDTVVTAPAVDVPAVPDEVGPPPDTSTCDDFWGLLGYGAPCEEDAHCCNGLCLPTAASPSGLGCTKPCLECPEAWTCGAVYDGPDPLFVCVYRFDTLCRPCAGASDCLVGGEDPEGCQLDATGAAVCLTDCSWNGECPQGFSCADLDGTARCLPDGGSCPAP